MRDSTISIHGHDFYDKEHGCFIVPIYQAAQFEQFIRDTLEPRKTDRGTELKYSREENPTVRCLERVLAKLDEGEDALCFSSGMAAISAIYFCFLKKGDTLLVTKEGYGTTIQLAQELSKFGIKTILIGPDTEKMVEDIIDNRENARIVLIETMTNPTLRVIDVPQIAKVCEELGITLIVDNTFVTPILYKPLRDNARLVVHSATKYLAGHNDVVAGVIIGSRDLVMEVWDWRRKLGTIISPFDAFLVLRGLKTLEIRVRKHCKNALAIAEFLKEHPKIEEVLYPGLPDSPYHKIAKKLFKEGLFGGVVSFKVKGGLEEAMKVMMSTKIIRPAPSLGGTESLITCPALSAAARLSPELRKELGITENLLRLAVGLEDVNDLIEDLDNALRNI